MSDWLVAEPRRSKDRQNLLLYTSCHAHQILLYLNQYRPDIRARYNIDATLVHVLYGQREVLDSAPFLDLFRQADVVLYHPLRPEKYQAMAPGHMLQYCKPDCLKIPIPSPDMEALWPITPHFGLDPVRKLKEEGLSPEKIIEKFRNGTFDPMFEMRWARAVERLRYKDERCRAKIADFVVEHRADFKLWMTFNHPSFPLIAYIVEQCVAILGDKVMEPDFITSLPPNAYGWVDNFPETQYEFTHYGLRYPMTCPNDRGGLSFYLDLIRNA